MSFLATMNRERLVRGGLLGIMLVVVVTLILYVLQGPSRRIPAVSVSVLPQNADAGLREFSFVESKEGQVDWKIHAKEAQVFDADSKAILKDVVVTLSDARGLQMTVEGDDGTINTVSKDFVLSKRSGDLALVFEDGYTIYTPRLAWVNIERRFWTDEPVRITGPNRMEVTGQGMDTLLTTREMRIRRDARVEVH
ncbi:MAG: LPS export ABC transporter periplasmic protein LptC [Nitrospirae bacterium]|jgi:lipopolysaccharide export system protein LptC|nr:MAG: LPS export ABC transporter periplasmic protein LptC [Nitrospirota bacterium]